MSRGQRPLHELRSAVPDLTASAVLTVETTGEGFYEITAEARDFVRRIGAGDGLLTVFIRHTSASLTIQENADPDVQRDLLTALRSFAPPDAGWIHDSEGPDDMPAHIRAMLTGVSQAIPVVGGAAALGTWQGLYVIEHRARPHRREIVLHYLGSRSGSA